MKDYLIQRLQEPSTWRGITLLLTAIGVPLAPGLADAVITAGLAVAGLIGIVTKDR